MRDNKKQGTLRCRTQSQGLEAPGTSEVWWEGEGEL